ALAAAVAAGAIGSGGIWAAVVLPNFFLGRWSEFALGMCAAELHSRGLTGRWLRPITIAAVLCAAVGLLVPDNPLSHVFFGVVFFALLCAVLARGNRTAAAFSWRPLATIGVMSYSLYLVHQPLVEVFAAALGAGSDRSPRQVFLGLLLLLPVFLSVAWLLFVLVERRTLRRESVDEGWPRKLLFPRPPSRLARVAPARVPPTKSPIATGSCTPATGRRTSPAARAEGGQVVSSA
ncbi:MAG: acyltransferase family protein, partial [Frankiaceae bacterium]